jgi:starch synthase
MDRKLNILMVSSEMTPFAKTGGLADVVGALPKALAQRGHTVFVVLPKYGEIDGYKHGLRYFHGPMGVWMGGEQEWCAVHTTERDGVGIYFIEHNDFFDRPGLYHDKAMRDYRDNPRRFAFLSRAALQLCLDKGFRPDVVHAHDWQTALIPAYLRIWNWDNTVLWGVPSVLTIHNLAYQGIYHKANYPYMSLGWGNFTPDKFEYYDAINMLKGGIYFADMVNTVSPTYADEIRAPGRGNGLDDHLRWKGDRFWGILNGVDYDVWNPEHDRLLPATYNVFNLDGKKHCKWALQEHFGLRQDDNVALLGLVGRFTEQKGHYLFAQILEHLLWNVNVQVVVLGSGEKDLEGFFTTMAHRYGDRVGTHIGFSEPLAHLIEAGSDFFVMPSRFEPCGLNQIYSLRYGTLPIVRATGGLNDTVYNYDPGSGNGTGFKFYDFTPEALFNTIVWAVATYYDRKDHQYQLIGNAMGQRFTWDMSAMTYEYAYLRAMGLH